MKVWVDGGKSVSLSQKDFLAQGGEGAVYVRSGVAYKVYSDPAKVIAAGKLRELAAIADPRIIKPQHRLLDQHGVAVGYTMRHVEQAYVLCQLFTRAFRDRSGVTPRMTVDLVRAMQAGVESVHAAHALVVDLNEVNLLVPKSFDDVFFIDVDSYQTPSYPATALMESVRDRHAKPGVFDERTDWFAFAIVSFQLFIGMHPYKGKHPTLPNLDARMQNNASVFDRDVTMPKSAYPLEVIPKPYWEWYRAVLQDGERTSPPSANVSIVVLTSMRPPAAGRTVEVIEHGVFDGNILDVWTWNQQMVVRTHTGMYLNGRRVVDAPTATVAVGFATQGDSVVTATVVDGRLVLFDLVQRRRLDLDVSAEAATTVDGRIYIKNGEQLFEIVLTTIGNRLLASARAAAAVLAHATHLHDGVAVEDLVGSTRVILFPRTGSTLQHHLAELDGAAVIDARYRAGVLMVLIRRAGRWLQLVYRFTRDHDHWDVRQFEVSDAVGLNFVTLDTGVCISMVDGDAIEMFAAAPGVDGTRRVVDDAIGGDMLWTTDGGRLLAIRGDRLYRVTMRKETTAA